MIPGESFAEKLRALDRYGFEGVELNGEYLNDAAGFAERKAALADSPVRASSICGGYPAELVHPDKARRQACADAIMRHLDYAAELGAVGPIVVPIFNNNERIPVESGGLTRSQVERVVLVDMLLPLAEYAQGMGRSVLLEPLNRYESNSLPTQSDGAAVVRAIGSPGLRLMSDLFHMHIEETDTPATIRACGDVIGHVHLADNTRKEPGSGDIDFAAALAALNEVGFNGWMAFECGLTGPANEVLPRSAAYLKELM